MRISWIRARGAVVVSAAIMALQSAPALAQFVPYTPGANQSYNQYQAHTAPQYQAQQQLAAPQYTQPQYTQPQYTAMAFQGSDTRGAAPTLSQPVESVAPGQMMQSAPMQSAPLQSVPMQSYSAAPAAGCNCQSTPATSYESYPGGASCGTYNTFDGGCGLGYNGIPGSCCNSGGCGVGGCGVGGGCLGAGRGCGRRWFGGFYGLYLQRAESAWVPIAFSTDQATPYYPARTDYVLNLQDVTETEHAGAEFRFGATLGSGGCGCGPRFAWEAAYWGIVEEDASAQFVDVSDVDATRLYTNMDFRGLEYDPDGAGALDYRQLNHYVDYGPPTADYTTDQGGNPVPQIRVRSVSVRNQFSAQNIELNLLRLPVFGGGCCGGCNSGCCGAGGCGLGGRLGRGAGVGCGGSRYSVTTLIGARYLRLDEDFFLDVDSQNTGTGAVVPLSLNAEADNHLVGLQLGCNGCYRLGCAGRWALNCSANAGIYGNHAEVSRSIDMPAAGVLRYVGNGSPVFTTVESEEDEIATIAELRAGLSYQYSCNWRFFGGYRALGVSGIALAFDQLPPDWSSPAQVADYVNTSGSIFLHGLQGGIECTY